MTDYVRLLLMAGDGGRGRISFRREKYAPKGGPDGGGGGDGGDIIIRGNHSLATLAHFAGNKEFVSEAGELGGKKKQTGKKGEALVLEVPLGTVIWHIKENTPGQTRRLRYGLDRLLKHGDVHQKQFVVEIEGGSMTPFPPEFEPIELDEDVLTEEIDHKIQLQEIREHGQEFVICQGGFGGRGNESFKSATNQAPLTADFGTPGEDRFVALELKLLADVGLVGFPSVGKSTLLSVLTKARPKIAAYPFTTLSPNLGILESEGSDQSEKREVVIADIPGLVEGASEGKGLGFEFLRHVSNCEMLLFVLALNEEDFSNTEMSAADKVASLQKQYQKLKIELDIYGDIAKQKRSLICINKIDIYDNDILDILKNTKDLFDTEMFLISSGSTQGIAELKHRLLFPEASK